MNADRFLLIRSRIVALLKPASPYLFPVANLQEVVKNTVYPAVLPTEFEHVIERMEAEKQLLRVPNADEGVKCKLTELGLAEL